MILINDFAINYKNKWILNECYFKWIVAHNNSRTYCIIIWIVANKQSTYYVHINVVFLFGLMTSYTLFLGSIKFNFDPTNLKIFYLWFRYCLFKSLFPRMNALQIVAYINSRIHYIYSSIDWNRQYNHNSRYYC